MPNELTRPSVLDAEVRAAGKIAVVPTILDVVCRLTGMGFAAVARVTEDRWIACNVKDDIAFGLEPGGELQVETTICHEIRQSREAVVVNNVSEDEKWCQHHTPIQYGFQSYISMPIILPDGRFFGTLCAIDPWPARLNSPEIIGMFAMFADLIAFHLDAQNRVEESEALLSDERQTAIVRDQFIAVLGHDLRNPLAAIDAGVRLLKKTSLDARETNIATLIQGSVVRMAGLIDNVLDFARGRLGGGLSITRAEVAIEPVLQQVIDELAMSLPGREIEARFDLPDQVRLDAARIAQVFSNLLANALTHGAPDRPVRVAASAINGVFALSVANDGPPIDAVVMDRLFRPFFRGEVRDGQQGLGLGLFIASEIAHAHDGQITVASSKDETRFTPASLRQPLPAPGDIRLSFVGRNPLLAQFGRSPPLMVAAWPSSITRGFDLS